MMKAGKGNTRSMDVCSKCKNFRSVSFSEEGEMFACEIDTDKLERFFSVVKLHKLSDFIRSEPVKECPFLAEHVVITSYENDKNIEKSHE